MTFLKRLYAPLLREMRDQSRSEDNRRALRGRASADTMQALTSQFAVSQTQNVSRAGDLSQALGGQLGVANADLQNKFRIRSLRMCWYSSRSGRRCSERYGTGKRTATSEALNRARASLQDERSARSEHAAAAQIAGADAYQSGGDKTRKFFDALSVSRGHLMAERAYMAATQTSQ